MSFTYENEGTIAVTHGSTTVTGTGTAWAPNYAGILLNIDGLSYPVASVDSVNGMTLSRPYPGTTATGLSYELLPLQAENYQLSKAVNSVLQTVTSVNTGGSGGAEDASDVTYGGDYPNVRVALDYLTTTTSTMQTTIDQSSIDWATKFINLQALFVQHINSTSS